MRFRHIATALAALFSSSAALATPDGFTHYQIGDPATPAPSKPEAALLLAGGGEWDTEAFRWFVAKAGHGHIVVLRASQANEAGEAFYKEIGGVTAVDTFVFDDRKAAYDPRVLAVLAKADGVYIAGGDQSRYVRYWKGTPVAAMLDTLAKNHPIAGTSAGLAIMGDHSYGCMDGGSVTAGIALRDPTGPAVTMVDDFLHLPHMTHVISDTHFIARDRMGRLIAFLAQVRGRKGADADPLAIGIGVDQGAALAVDAQGIGRLFSPPGGYAWLVEPTGQPQSAPGNPLDFKAIRITAIGPDSRIDLTTRKVTAPVFGGTANVAKGRLTGVPYPADARWSLAIHGGAGVAARGTLTPQEEKAYRDSLAEALNAGSAVLKRGGSSMDAVEAAVRVLEDSPLFNAGRGAVFAADGVNYLDAAIMNGSSTEAGAVAGVTTTRNPVTLARAVMEHSPHVLLTGAGADAFARTQGVEQVSPSYFRTEKRWQEYLDWKKENGIAKAGGNPGQLYASRDPSHRFGTVGAVARDVFGHLAAATSTGGLTGKRWGRVGDSPLIGAGTYALDGTCAVSATGTGEFFIRQSAARQVCDRIAWHHESIAEAAGNTIDEVAEIGGDGGLIAIDNDGHVGFAQNTAGMYRGAVGSSQPPVTAIYAEEAPPLP